VKTALGELGESFSVHLETYTLGEKAVQFGHLHITDSIQNTADPDQPELRVMTVRSQIAWSGNMRATAVFGSMSMGMTDLRLDGDLVMELVGHTPKPPLFQAARACFMKPPKISLECHSGVDILNSFAKVGPVKDAIIKVVTDQLSAKMLVPNRMGVKLEKSADVFRTLHPPPRGMLRLQIPRADGLKGMDTNLFSKATSDPLILLVCGALKYQSKVVKATTSPQFHYDLLVPIHHPSEQFLNIKLVDVDLVGGNDFLGQLELRVKDLIIGGASTEAYELEDQNGQTGASGRIWLSAEWRELECIVSPRPPIAGDAPILNCLHLFVGVVGVKHLPHVAPGTKYWVEVQCTGRLGVMGGDTTTSKRTPKKEVQVQELFEEERAAENELWEERKAICKKYKMTNADMAKLLGVEEESLASPESVSTAQTNIKWDKALPFFITKDEKSVVTITLKYEHGGVVQTTSRSLVMSAAATIREKMRQKVSQKLGEDGAVIHTWHVPINKLERVLKVPQEPTSLSLHFRLMEMGELSREP